MRLGQYSGKQIKITAISGQILQGFGDCYSSEHDNPEGIASICIGDIIIFENEIANIEIIQADRPATTVPA